MLPIKKHDPLLRIHEVTPQKEQTMKPTEEKKTKRKVTEEKKLSKSQSLIFLLAMGAILIVSYILS